jgi:hypothetical protein
MCPRCRRLRTLGQPPLPPRTRHLARIEGRLSNLSAKLQTASATRADFNPAHEQREK